VSGVREANSGALGSIQCPGCGEYVALTVEAPMQTADVHATTPGKRWSFVRRPPSGAACPRRGFPLELYRRQHEVDPHAVDRRSCSPVGTVSSFGRSVDGDKSAACRALPSARGRGCSHIPGGWDRAGSGR